MYGGKCFAGINMANKVASSPDTMQCPVCLKDFTSDTINGHLDACLSTTEESGPPLKKSRISAAFEPPTADSSSSSSSAAGAPSSPMFSLFQTNKSKVSDPGGRNGLFSSRQQTATAVNKGVKRNVSDEAEPEPDPAPEGTEELKSQASGSNGQTVKASRDLSPRTLMTSSKPLAQMLRPTTLEEYFGQNKVVGQQTILRSLLDSQEIPSLILWGPPGCGKTTLAHIIASNSKKKGAARFVSLSATSASTSDVREVIKQAQNELRLCKRKTIMFIDEIHRFNKSQQVNAALLSRCRVLVLEKLSVEAMGFILNRAVAKLGIGVLEQDQATPEQQDPSDGHDLQLAVQAQVNTATGSQELLVKEEHVKEGLQRAHILYDKAGEEHFNCISALHKSMRGSDENASLYWLGRMLEGGEEPLYVARRLVRFASEDVILAQCVVYLARAPKSVDIYKAYGNVKACLRNQRGPLPPVPLHLRNASTGLMKQLGYAKGYKYNPSFSGRVEQQYLPEELQGTDFFTWTPT
ncbi:ATPase WRNIP1 [Liparis tanakae]|uniref:ATPase WRNIP1 n=1 Tax=Liparis tanakae TaxID=230148 RepID=A0A4Z2GN88_9TELE|nr:ATPase WRNIP1 [Liparis tanakae]